MKFLDIYKTYKLQYGGLLTEGNVRTLTSIIEKKRMYEMFKHVDYKKLTDEEKQQLQTKVNSDVVYFSELHIPQLTSNKQYQSWIYDMYTKMMETLYDIETSTTSGDEQSKRILDYLKNDIGDVEINNQLFENFSKICRSPKCDSFHRNIMNYQSFKQLSDFVNDFKSKNLTYFAPQQFKSSKVYSTEKYDIYKITADLKKDFQDLYGAKGFDCGWCVVNPDRDMFEHYVSYGPYYLWTYKNTLKPFALLHYTSHQFKDIHNNAMTDTDSEIIDGLCHCSCYEEYYSSGDLRYYEQYIKNFNNNK